MSERGQRIALAALAAVVLAAPAAAQSRSPSRQDGDAFRATMDRVFGPGGWRQTGGFRTPAQEEALRRQGAGTVPRGRRSAHSVGSRAAPGAYDAVVPGMSQREAAARLRRGGRGLPKVIAEGPHGPQGSHLHIELTPGAGGGRRSLCDAYHGETIHLRVIGGRRNPLIECEERWRAARRHTSPEPASGLLD